MKFVFTWSARSSATRASCSAERRRPLVPERGLHFGRYVQGGDESALRVADRDRARSDDSSGRLEYALRHFLLGLGKRQQARDCLLHPSLLRRAPEDAEQLRRRKGEEERDHADERDTLRGEREPRVLIRARDREQERERDERCRQCKRLHAPPRHRRLRTPGGPEAPRGHDREHRPVDEEDGDPGLEPGRPMLVRGRDAGQRERPDDEDRAEDEETVRELRVGAPERVREPEEEIRKEDEQGNDDADVELLEEVAAVRWDETQELEEPERPERDRCPPRGPVAPPQPEAERDRPERHVRDEIDVAKYLNRAVQGWPLP